MKHQRPLLLAVFVLGGVSASSASAAGGKPNFLFILTDDQAPHTLGAYGNTVCHTPNIDRLAKEGRN
ncbi:MAG: sulfatase-like hydrolase/transferase [Bacteroidetes bacterium]|nr:sulfatase-like hydrolase/transferase [Bacteroidota bacterium]